MTKLKISDKGYMSIPHRHQGLDINLYVQDANWYSKFVRLCQPTSQVEFDRHVGPDSAYELKTMLTNSLKFHYVVLSGALENVNPCFKLNHDQKTAIIAKIIIQGSVPDRPLRHLPYVTFRYVPFFLLLSHTFLYRQFELKLLRPSHHLDKQRNLCWLSLGMIYLLF